MLKIFKNSAPTPSLRQLDNLYGQTICKCPLQEQISYCQRVIESSEYHLGQSCPKKDSNQLKQLIQAARDELKQLRSQVGS
ncbi:MAG TPA: hypothetical protein DEF18_01775 [Muricauda sp.]|uniref:Orphan protein n=1 Tax=Flagellimonas aurea TaxID=2915619 RepID=A0ABS3G3W9_9FLAO|nr:hypothetical protein [Allomuricauda aurea]MBC72758.1 hypothetical protein [Allomuricauda sp.]MBO0353277.1 hypothetical protein [Allomuricauda aurea]UBZ13613.1 hypothetical protein LDL77_17230 [Allomuricauda aquimarina]HBU76809.1 hypothetical protein [Allomuricauda sp.]|tara:strand:- start:398 stop:640 length:243 start_codon:yes stop_codon:yes gene_type:complete